jgi:hypothetical protein
MAYVGNVRDWSTEVKVESGLFNTHLTVQDGNDKVTISLDKTKVKQLIKLLEKSIQ